MPYTKLALMSSWSIEYSTDAVTGHAWGRSIQDEFAAYDAHLFILVHTSGSVYLVIVGNGSDSDEILVLRFDRFWQAATVKQWGSSRLTYRGDHGGLFLAFHDGLCLEAFEECCDRVLRVHTGAGVAPTLEDMQGMGIVPLPRLVGGFLNGPLDDAGTDPTWSESSSSSSDADSTVDTIDAFTEEELAVLSREIEEYGRGVN